MNIMNNIKTTRCLNRCPKISIIKNQGMSKKHQFLLVLTLMHETTILGNIAILGNSLRMEFLFIFLSNFHKTRTQGVALRHIYFHNFLLHS